MDIKKLIVHAHKFADREILKHKIKAVLQIQGVGSRAMLDK